MTADDVVYSVLRGQQPTSQINNYAAAVGTPKKIDDLTVEFTLAAVNPIFLEHLDALWIMSKAWSEKNKVTRPLDFKNQEESYAARNADGTGPYMLVSRAPGIKTTYRRNPNYWAKTSGNVQEIVFTPIANDATRLAALVSGEVDFVLDPAPRDVARLRSTPGVQVIDGPENRVVFIGMDQGRDELLYSSVKGRNPFKDLRVRKAVYQAINTELIVQKVLRGAGVATGAFLSTRVEGSPAELDRRLPFDPAKAKALLAEAGYPNGFSVTLDCVNVAWREAVCQAMTAMLTQVGIRTTLRSPNSAGRRAPMPGPRSTPCSAPTTRPASAPSTPGAIRTRSSMR